LTAAFEASLFLGLSSKLFVHGATALGTHIAADEDDANQASPIALVCAESFSQSSVNRFS
jgi:hypothetical protein